MTKKTSKKTETRGFDYKIRWPGTLYCPLGKVRCKPLIIVHAENSRTIPFKEVDVIAAKIKEATYEDAASQISHTLVDRYGGRIKVELKDRFFSAYSEVEDLAQSSAKGTWNPSGSAYACPTSDSRSKLAKRFPRNTLR